jgi:hypothetical protein
MQLTKADIDEMALIIHKSNALVGAAPEMLGMLKRLEWSATDADSYGDMEYSACPECSSRKGTPHWSRCELAALIARAEGGTPTPDGCGESR